MCLLQCTAMPTEVTTVEFEFERETSSMNTWMSVKTFLCDRLLRKNLPYTTPKRTDLTLYVNVIVRDQVLLEPHPPLPSRVPPHAPLTQYTKSTLARFSKISDPVSRVLGGGVAKRYAGRLRETGYDLARALEGERAPTIQRFFERCGVTSHEVLLNTRGLVSTVRTVVGEHAWYTVVTVHLLNLPYMCTLYKRSSERSTCP